MPVRLHYRGKVLIFPAIRNDEPCLTSPTVTSEEVTAKRREQRKRFKVDRANAIAAAAAEAEEAFRAGRTVPSPIAIPSGATWKPADETSKKQNYSKQDRDWDVELDDIVDIEHLQLTPQEAFFLIWCFDCLSVLNPHTVCLYTCMICHLPV